MNKDLQWFAARYRVPYQWNPHFPINTLQLMRGATYAQQKGRLLPYSDVVYKAVWADGVNMSDAQEVGRVLSAGGFDPDEFMAAVQDPAIKQALKDATDDAVRKGLFGAPTFIVDGHMHFGQDRLPYVEELLRA